MLTLSSNKEIACLVRLSRASHASPNMSSQPNLGIVGFVPQQLVTMSVGRYQLNLYPKLSPGTSLVECAHAYQICKSAIAALKIDIRVIFDALGLQLNCMAMINGLVYNFTQVYQDGWFDPANLQILSFHNSAGTRINNTTVAGNPTVYLPVINGVLANCCQQDVRFVRIQVSLDFAHLLGAGHIGGTVLKSMYYLELPQQSVNMINSAGATYVLTTYHGPTNITAMTAQEVNDDIICPCLQHGLITLSGTDFNLQEANIDSAMVKDQLISKLLLLGFDAICASVFAVLCPVYFDQPHAVQDHIRQASPGPNGQMIVVRVHEFIQHVINTWCPFAARKMLPISICNHIIRNLNRRIIPSFRKLYANHAMSLDLDGAFQCRRVQEILAAAQQAEDEVHQVQDIAQGITGQSFHMFVLPPGIPAMDMPAMPIVRAYPSQAERTLAKY
jgi:hypothetical protein